MGIGGERELRRARGHCALGICECGSRIWMRPAWGTGF